MATESSWLPAAYQISYFVVVKRLRMMFSGAIFKSAGTKCRPGQARQGTDNLYRTQPHSVAFEVITGVSALRIRLMPPARKLSPQ